MNLALQIGDSRISCERVLQQLYDSQLLPQLLREMVIDELVDAVAREFQIQLTPTPAEFERLSAQVAEITPFQGMNSEQIAAIATRTLKLHKFKQAGWGHKVSTYYQSIKHQLHRVVYSILQIEDGLLVQELFFRVQSGEQSFAELAVKYSQAESAQRGGVVGPILTREVPPEILQIITQLAPGELSPLFQLENRSYGFIRLNDLMPPLLDENMHQVLLDELFEDWIQGQIASEVGNTSAMVTNQDLAIAPSFSTSQIPESVAPVTAKINGNGSENRSTGMEMFTPDFGYKEAILAEFDSRSTILTQEQTTIPEVTVVTEPEVTDLDVSTGFFFGDRPAHPTFPASTLTGKEAIDLEPVSDRPIVTPHFTPTRIPSPRWDLLISGICISISLAIVSVAANHYLSHNANPARLLPQPLRGWIDRN